jgi:hypothetical protein
MARPGGLCTPLAAQANDTITCDKMSNQTRHNKWAKSHTFSQISMVLILASVSLVLLAISLNTGQNVAQASRVRQSDVLLTPTHFVYLPVISYEVACTNPPSGTVMIGGRATVHGQPARAGIPFRLLYSVHWDSPPYYILTTTTQSEGGFCFGPVDMLEYRGSWYIAVFNPEWISDEGYIHWASPMLRYSEIESGKVYTFVAEIGE